MGIFTNDDSTPVTPAPKKSAPSALSTIFTSNQAQAVVYSTPRALTAAAAQLKVNDKGEYEQFRVRRAAASSAWQAEAWEYYDAIGEVKYAFNLVASVVSRIRRSSCTSSRACSR
jgi:hypothetical protein